MKINSFDVNIMCYPFVYSISIAICSVEICLYVSIIGKSYSSVTVLNLKYFYLLKHTVSF